MSPRPRDEEPIGLPYTLKVNVGTDHQTAGRTDQVTTEAGRADVVHRFIAACGSPPVGTGEHLQRTGHVKALHALDENDEHRLGQHEDHADLAGQMAATSNFPTFLTSARPAGDTATTRPGRSPPDRSETW